EANLLRRVARLLRPERDALVGGAVVRALGVDEVQRHAGVDRLGVANRAPHVRGVLRTVDATRRHREGAALRASGRANRRAVGVHERVPVAASTFDRGDLIAVVLAVCDQALCRGASFALGRVLGLRRGRVDSLDAAAAQRQRGHGKDTDQNVRQQGSVHLRGRLTWNRFHIQRNQRFLARPGQEFWVFSVRQRRFLFRSSSRSRLLPLAPSRRGRGGPTAFSCRRGRLTTLRSSAPTSALAVARNAVCRGLPRTVRSAEGARDTANGLEVSPNSDFRTSSIGGGWGSEFETVAVAQWDTRPFPST